MARNDWVTFEETSLGLMNGKYNLDSDTIKLALVDDTITPTAADDTPQWADYSANEVSGTGYVAGGYTLTGTSTSEVGGVTTFDDTGNVTWAQNGAGPTNIHWGILVDTTTAGNDCLGFIDMGGPVSMVDGPVTATWHASGILAATVTA